MTVTVRAWDGSSGSGSDGSPLGKGFSVSILFSQKGMVPVSVPEKRFRRFRFLMSVSRKTVQRGWSSESPFLLCPLKACS